MAQPSVSRRARELVIVAALLVIALLVLRANLKAPSELGVIDRVVLRLSAPVQGALASLGRGIADVWHKYVALVGLGEENRRLLAENARLRTELGAARGKAVRGAELEKLLGLRDAAKVETVAARIVGAETSPLYRVVRVRLDRGELEVRPGMAVLAPEGVVGRVHRVFGAYSDVLLLSDPQSAYDVIDRRTGARGIVRGLPGDDRYRLRIDYLLRKDEVQVGDEIVTSGLGGVPRELSVGKVVKITKKDFGLYQEAELEPAVDFGRLRDVLVVVAPPPPPPAGQLADGAAAPAGGDKK